MNLGHFQGFHGYSAEQWLLLLLLFFLPRRLFLFDLTPGRCKKKILSVTEFSMHTYIDTHIVISVNLEWAGCILLGCLIFPTIYNSTVLCSDGVSVFDAMGSVCLLKTMFIFPFISVNAFLHASFFSALKLCCLHCELRHAKWRYAVSQ